MDGHLRWCSSCTKRQPVATTDLGLICCTRCGKVVDQDIFSSEPVFEKNAAGQSKLGGNIVRTVQGETPVSRERTLNKAYDFITDMADYLGVGGGDQIAQPAVRFYEIAVEKNFVRGLKADQVAAACLYIAFRCCTRCGKVVGDIYSKENEPSCRKCSRAGHSGMNDHMLWCSSCTKHQPVSTTDLGLICCTRCGKVVAQHTYSNEPSCKNCNRAGDQVRWRFCKDCTTGESSST